MKPFHILLALSVFAFIPGAANAQMKSATFAEGSVTETTRRNQGTEALNVEKTTTSWLTGTMNNSTVGVSLSGSGVSGDVSGLMLDLSQQMRTSSNPNALKEQLENNPVLERMFGEEMAVGDGFSLSTTMSLDEAEYEMGSNIDEIVKVNTVKNFDETVFTDGWSTENGFLTDFSN